MLNAEPPDRFSIKFLENLGFTSTNDRLLIGILKDLSFIDQDGVPLQRYYDYLDKSAAPRVLAESIKDTYSDLFAVNKRANELSSDDVKSKLRTLYKGAKTDLVIGRIAKTFEALCQIADFSAISAEAPRLTPSSAVADPDPSPPEALPSPRHTGFLRIQGLQYHINIVLPETRDQAVFDAIFRSLREHLG